MIVVRFNTTFKQLRNVYNAIYLYIRSKESAINLKNLGIDANEMDLVFDNIV